MVERVLVKVSENMKPENYRHPLAASEFCNHLVPSCFVLRVGMTMAAPLISDRCTGWSLPSSQESVLEM